jgi:hypothetical protein
MYMADPSESGQPATDTKEDPDWLLNFRKQKSETTRKIRAKAAKKKRAHYPVGCEVDNAEKERQRQHRQSLLP